MIAVRRHALPNLPSKAYDYAARSSSFEAAQDAVEEATD